MGCFMEKFIKYSFVSKEEKTKHYLLTFDDDFNILRKFKLPKTMSSFVALENNKCSHCPLKNSCSKNCPVAENMAHILQSFNDKCSFNTTKVIVETNERIIVKETEFQYAIQSLIGLVMATSGCPHFSFFKSMARFHLPFSTLEETIVRAISFYLFHNFVNDEPSYNLKGLNKIYEKVIIVNRNMLLRFKDLPFSGDANQNAISILDSFAQMVPLEISSKMQCLTKFQKAS